MNQSVGDEHGLLEAATGHADVELAGLNVSAAATDTAALPDRGVSCGKDVEAELRLLSERLDALIRSSSEVRYIVNADWTKLHQLTGGGFLADTSISNANWVEGYIPAEDQPALYAEIARSMAAKDTYDIVHRVNQADGTVGWAHSRAVPLFDADGNVAEWMGAASDITARRRAEIALQELADTLEHQVEERTRERDQVWNTSIDPICVASLEGQLLQVNPAWTTILGWSREELIAGPLVGLVHPDDADATARAFRGLAAQDAQSSFEHRLRRRDGSYRWFSWNAVPGDGLIYAVIRDITDAKAQALVLRQTEEALRQAQKMEAVGQLTGGLAHDFNNLLMGMMGNLELLQMRVASGHVDELDRFILAAQGAGKRAASLTHRLLAFSRRQTLDPKPTNLNRLMAGMEDLLRRTVGPQVTIEMIGAAGLWAANIDAGQMENALLNLSINARDAMPLGGRLVIEATNICLDDRSAGELDLDPGEYLFVSVTDTGTGMTEATMARAFEPFYTTKPLGQGTGLGLSMIYGFARQSRGHVRISSELGRGTTICLYLPRHLGDAEDEVVAAGSRKILGSAGQTVLVIDDEPTIRHLVDEVLDDLGYTVIGAGDGVSGLKILESGVRIDLLVTDVGLPNGLNGRQLADAARQLRPDLKVLFITGYVENAADRNGQLEAGMELLTKPFSLQALIAKVSDMMKERPAQ
jgi:PAS domain S-box-containing protein